MKNRVCIILGRIYKNTNRQLLESITSQLDKTGISEVVFTLNEDSGNDKILSSELNLFELINFELFDSVIYAPYTFSANKYCDYLDKFLAERCPLPVVRVDIEDVLCSLKNEKTPSKGFDFMRFELDFLDNTLSAVFHDAETLNELTEKMFYQTYTFMDKSRRDKDAFSLCLCDDWTGQVNENGTYMFRTKGYSDNILMISEHSRVSISKEQLFTDNMWNNCRDKMIIVSPASFMDRCFGYCCLTVSGNTNSYNPNYVRFCRELCSGLAFLSIQDKMKSLSYRKFISETRDSLTGLYKFSESESIIKSMLDDAERRCEPAYIMVLKAENMAEKREEYGSAVYDRFIVKFAEYAYETSPKGARIFVVSDDLFILIGSGSFSDMRGYSDGQYTKEKLADFSMMKDSYPDISFQAMMFVPEYDVLQKAYKRITEYIRQHRIVAKREKK